MEDLRPILFGPKSAKSLMRQYPELRKEKEFKDISGDDLLFSWYIGNESSPIDPDWGEQIRYKTAAAYAIRDEKMRAKYASMDVPDKVKEAIERMKKYSPEARMVAKRMVQAMFHNLQKIVNVDVEDLVTVEKEFDDQGNVIAEKKEMDSTARKQYVDTCKTVSQTLPGLIEQLETGFGISEEKEKGTTGVKAIDKFHQENRENL